jgi:hypothetical protein
MRVLGLAVVGCNAVVLAAANYPRYGPRAEQTVTAGQPVYRRRDDFSIADRGRQIGVLLNQHDPR